MGSSPLTRGIQYYNAHTPLGQRFIPAHAGNKKKQATITCQNRFIPAHAGNTSLTQALELSTWVHPRSRGEYARKQSDCVRSAGSSPLTRGILSVFFLAVHTPGFIPAHAGNTGRQALPSGRLQVHPRSRGEYLCGDAKEGVKVGSPPLTRGIPENEV